MAWQGLPGSSFGGMNNRAGVPSLADEYRIVWSAEDGQQGRNTEIQGLPIPTWSSRSLTAVWWSQLPPPAEDEEGPHYQLRLQRETRVVGMLVNPLPVEIKDAAIAYGRMYYEIGDLPPGGVFELNESSRPLNFRFRLTRRRIINDKEIVNPWDKESFDVPRILEMIMFHDHAGGRMYTDLLNRYHGKLDLSDHLQTGTAVLYGRLAHPVTQWQSAPVEFDQDCQKQWTYCRLLYPLDVPDPTTIGEGQGEIR